MTVDRAQWAKSLQLWGGIHPTKFNQWALVAWEAAESGYHDSSGGWHAGALWNPLNTTQKMPNSWDYNWVPVQDYDSEVEGLEATWKTLNNKRYAALVNQLRAGNNATALLEAVQNSEWGTGTLALRILHDVRHYWSQYSTKLIGQ